MFFLMLIAPYYQDRNDFDVVQSWFSQAQGIQRQLNASPRNLAAVFNSRSTLSTGHLEVIGVCKNSKSRERVHFHDLYIDLFLFAHNLKVVGSNPAPATEMGSYEKLSTHV